MSARIKSRAGRRIPAPPVAFRYDRLAALVPGHCPACGCASRRIAMVEGGDDRRPIVEVTFSCGEQVSVGSVLAGGARAASGRPAHAELAS